MPGVQPSGSELLDALDLSLDVFGAQVEVHPVLARLCFRHPLQQQRGLRAVLWKQEEVGLREADLAVAEGGGPEVGQRLGVGAVDDQV